MGPNPTQVPTLRVVPGSIAYGVNVGGDNWIQKFGATSNVVLRLSVSTVYHIPHLDS